MCVLFISYEKFPPNIYYKIFTHHNIVDMCANAPRDYTKASTKRLPVNFVHNKGQTMEEGERFGQGLCFGVFNVDRRNSK